MMNRAKTSGFTLIELVVVIALLGILAAFAIPRFASLEREARIATGQGLAGSLRSAAAMAHGLSLATGAAQVTMEGQTIDIANGYPDAETIDQTLADLTGFTVSDDGTTATFVKTGASGTCEVTYAEAAVNGAPTITPNLGSC